MADLEAQEQNNTNISVEPGQIKLSSQFPILEGMTRLREIPDKILNFKLQFAGTMVRFFMDSKEDFDDDSYSNLLFLSSEKISKSSVIFILKYFLSEYIDTVVVEEDEQNKE